MEGAGFPEAVRQTAERYGMDLGRPLVMVSGGPDSVALLRVVLDLGGKPVALHVDHGLREESPEDAEFVRGLCGRLAVRCEIRGPRLEEGANLQERARRERYRLAEEVAGGLGLRTVATGHTADDVAETVLMNLARGAGLRGLAGIPPVRGGRVVRPLIERTRQEVLAYLADLDQPYLTDPTNLTGKYARNRVRSEILPVLQELYPGATRNLTWAASVAREDLEALEALAESAIRPTGAEVVVPLGAFLELAPALRRHAVRRAYSAVLPDAPPLGSTLVGAVLGLAEGGEGTRTLDLPGGIVAAARGGEELAFYQRAESPEGEVGVRVGETVVFGGWGISTSEVCRYEPEDAARAEVAYLDASKGPYGVRAVREGDMIRPLGLGGSKKVLRAMMDRKVPSDLRRRMPVVVGGDGGVAWIPLGELGDGFKVDAKTEKILRLEVARIS